MKQQKFFGIILVFCVLVTLAGCASATTFDGSRVKNEDSYQLDIKTMNCTDTHTLELEQGDTIKIEFETENGNLSMKITAPDGTALYQGDGTVKEFTVEAPMDGAYPIVVVGQKAKGSIHIDVERVPEAVELEETDQSSMKMEFTAEKTDDGTFLYTEYKGLLLCWSQGEGETGKGGDDEAESGYPGADVVELVNLRGDTTTVYKFLFQLPCV